MIKYLTYAMVYLGSLIMVYNIYGFVRFAINIRSQALLPKRSIILHLPIILLVLFLLGYVFVAVFGKPSIVVAGILFGGSVFVFLIYELLTHITASIAQNEHLQAQLMAVTESNRAKSAFLASVSHEMRTPLNVIIGLDTVALKEPDLAPETKHRLEKIGESAEYLLGLVNNILDLNNSEEHKITVKDKPFSLNDAVKQVNALVSTLCEEKGLTYKFTSHTDTGVQYSGDETKLKQLLLILLGNAVKYTPAPGTVEFSADCTVSADNTHTLSFTVSDTGIGIDKDFLPQVFKAFACEDSSSTGRGGSGLGLAVAKEYCELMGGMITVKSEKNVGSVFTVTLPAKPIKASDNTLPHQDVPVTLKSRRILIVEDIPENAEIVADLLELEGAISEHAQNGKIGVDMFLASPKGYYDAILMDLRMPVMDGLTATKAIRSSDHPDASAIPIIALSANAFEEDINKSLSSGMDAHLAKPADAGLLYTTLGKFIGSVRK